MKISGFTLVRNGEVLDFPVEASIRSILADRFHVAEATIQIERGACADDPGCALAGSR